MGFITGEHRPLRGGVEIISARGRSPRPERIGSGTLTGLATRNEDNQKVLVTCLHVMSGYLNLLVTDLMPNLRDDEEMYQGHYGLWRNRVGDEVEGKALKLWPLSNRVDAAYCEAVLDRRNLSFYLHGGPPNDHETKILIAGTIEPEVGMAVKVLGSTNGEYDVTITRTGVETRVGLRNFHGLAAFERPSTHTTTHGDSGAPVVQETTPGSGLFNLVGILQSALEPPWTAILGNEVYLQPASSVESALKITFGKRPTTMHVFASPTNANVGDTVFLNGSGSLDPDGGELTFLWEQIEGPDVENFLTTNTSVASFRVPATLPEDDRRPLRFRVTATDEYNIEATAEVRANRKPMVNVVDGESNAIDGVIDAVVDTEVTLDASGSWDPDGDRLFFSWDQPGASDLIIPAEQRTMNRVTFTPTEEGRLVFDLTVSDGLGGESTQRITVNVVLTNQPPVANAGPAQQVGRSARVRLSGSVEDEDTGQAVTYEWSKIYGPDVTLHDSDTLTPYFDAPDDSVIFAWRLTARDPLGAEHSDYVIIFVDYEPDTQWEEWVPVVPPSYQGSGALREQYYTRSGVYLLPPIDEEGNARTDRIPASSGGSSSETSTSRSSTRSTTGSTIRSSARSTSSGAYVPFVADPFNPGAPDPEFDWFPAPDLPPTVSITDPGRSFRPGELVRLAGTVEPLDEGFILFWSQSRGPDVTLRPRYGLSTEFRAPNRPCDIVILFYAFDRQRRRVYDSVTVRIRGPHINAPTAEAGPEQRVDTGITVYLTGLDSQDGFGGTGATDEHGDLEYSWEAPSDAGITIQDANTGSPHFLAPETVGAINISLTVTNSIGLTDTDTVTINVVNTWGPWRDVVVDGSNVYDGEGAERRRKQVSTSELGNTKHRWVPDPDTTGPTQPPVSPMADAGSNQSVGYGDRVELNGIGSTPVGKLRFSWSESTGHGIILESAGTAYPYFTAPETYAVITVQLTVTHTESSETSTNSVTITVGSPPPPPAPTANAGPNQSVSTGASVTLDGSGSTNATGYSWARTGGLEVTLQNGNTASPTFTAPSTAGSVTFRLTVTNSGGQTDTDDVTITVQEPVQPPASPSADAGSNQSVGYGERVDLDGIGSTPVGKLSFSWTESSSHGIILESASTAYPYFTAPETYAVITVELTVTHTESSETSTDRVTITVGSPPAPPAPTANAGPNQSVSTGASVTLDGSGSTNATGYSWARTGGLEVTLQNGNTASPTFTAPSTAGSVTFRLTVTNSGGQTDTDDVTITVQEPVQPPASPSADAGSNQSVGYGERVDLDGIGSTPVGKLSFSWTESSSHGIILESASTAYPYFTAPETYAVITVELTVTHTESSETSTDRVTITVGSPPAPPPPPSPVSPSADAGSNQSVDYGDRVDLDGIGSTPVGKLSFSWTESSSHGIILESASTAYPYFTAPETYAVVTVELTVTHTESSETSTDRVTITVGSPPTPPPPPPPASPSADAGSDQSVGANVTVTLDGSGSSGGTGTLSYSWAETTNHNISLTGANTASPSFTSPGSAAIVTVQLTVTDSAGRTATDSVTITVTAPPPPPPPGEWSDWASTGVYKNENGQRWRQEMRHDIDDLSITEERWVDIGALSWGEWEFVQHEGSGASRVRVEQRATTYSSHNTTETREVPDPEEIWPSTWTPVEPASYQGIGEDRERLYERTSNLGNRQTRWQPDPEEIWPSTWTPVEPASYQGIGEDRERLYERTSNLGNRQTRWQPDPEEIWGAWGPVEPASYQGDLAGRKRLYERTSNLGNRQTEWRSDPKPEIWPDIWSATSTTQGDLADRERLYERFSNYGNRQTVWRSDPEPEVWGAFVRRSATRGSLADRERLYISTSNYGNTRDEWRSDPEPIVWGSWRNTGNYRGSLGNREQQQRRTSNYNTTETQWVSDPEEIEWGSWEDTGNYRGSLGNRKREQRRTSNYNTTETQWVSDPEPETWSAWTDTGNTEGSGAGREKEQSRTSNYGNTQTQWVSDPEGVSWGAWRNTGTYRGSLASREQRQKRTSNYGDVEYRWVDDPEPETWGSWTNTSTYRGSGPVARGNRNAPPTMAIARRAGLMPPCR